MERIILIIVTMDTKEEDACFLKEMIEKAGTSAEIIDVSTKECTGRQSYLLQRAKPV